MVGRKKKATRGGGSVKRRYTHHHKWGKLKTPVFRHPRARVGKGVLDHLKKAAIIAGPLAAAAGAAYLGHKYHQGQQQKADVARLPANHWLRAMS